jgi:hypothetical protein
MCIMWRLATCLVMIVAAKNFIHQRRGFLTARKQVYEILKDIFPIAVY